MEPTLFWSAHGKANGQGEQIGAVQREGPSDPLSSSASGNFRPSSWLKCSSEGIIWMCRAYINIYFINEPNLVMTSYPKLEVFLVAFYKVG